MKKAKIVSILTTTMMILFALTTVVSATEIGGVTINPDTSNTGNITNIGNDIIGVIQVVGTIIAVAMLLVLGVKYMMGSAEEKAANKKSMMPYLIGAILLFVGANAVSIIYSWANNISGV